MTAKIVKVVLVDDQESFRSAARSVIDMTAGFELVGEAGTAEEGFEVVEACQPDLVLMDVNLPGLDGLEATRRLVAGAASPRVIVLSTYEAVEFERRSLDAGAVAFLSKSDFAPDVLEQLWERSVEG